MDDRWLSVEEIAEYLGVSTDAVYSWVSTKGMPGHRVGRFWKFKRDEVDAWVRAGGAESAVGSAFVAVDAEPRAHSKASRNPQ